MVHARGSGADGTDTIRNIERLQFADVVPPSAPTSVTAVAGDGQATVGWKSPGGSGDGLRGRGHGDHGRVGDRTARDGPADATSLVVDGLTNGTSYTFRVRAINSAGPGDCSAASDAVTPEVFVPPPPPPGQLSQPADASLVASATTSRWPGP